MYLKDLHAVNDDGHVRWTKGKRRGVATLAKMGMSVSDAVRMMLVRVA